MLLFTNPSESVLLCNQRAAPQGVATVWDYHLVLQAGIDEAVQIFDLDTHLDFPASLETYVQNTFPRQAALPEYNRAWVRVIPALSYLEHFWSDRSHMQGHLPHSAFPDYPIIRPPAGVEAISLEAYRDIRRRLPDGSEVLPLPAWFPGA